ncbi:hypothetical protein BAUCODRAFT_144135 [Baudoinia panamericana UAMH 10762]|uniref:Zn(2)-C6 fungal-type domain-containing protein n=1 Tax=Baudoinia panamericana (strain UAMH 10762) TaxID=717646 RepID=M2M0D9_BAUPA|nr:uncharacterized protein BAUCODRAFT_144135 [Baudoinia panamericana UAMH 10762]EMD00468.1 hypothetical protein BAUCODRAFT_144135 [Baudoinia panamericana UAMH 10762]
MQSSNTKKREREDDTSPNITGAETGLEQASSAVNSTSNFRNVSACFRCRSRKNRCDQRLPKCSGCEKANVKCVGFDPVSKRAIPRNYVAYLESRVVSLETLLEANGVPCPPPENDFAINEAIRPGVDVPYPPAEEDGKGALFVDQDRDEASLIDPALQGGTEHGRGHAMKNAGVTTAKKARQSLHTSGIPFSKVVYAAVKSSVTSTPSSETVKAKVSKHLPSSTASGGGGSDSFFGLNVRPHVDPASFPDQSEATELVKLYFEYSNPQIPILHRGEFMSLMERVYATTPEKRKSRELYLLNIVFAVGSGIIMDAGDDERTVTAVHETKSADTPPDAKRQRVIGRRIQPEEYHAAAIEHLDSFLSTPSMETALGGLEELQAVLLLASLALLRPIAPGLWYIVGVAVRLAIDLGIHSEEPDAELETTAYAGLDVKKGRKQYLRDLRRRLWWSTYAFDRLVSTCVGRPFGINDQVITTPFPSLQGDESITANGFTQAPSDLVLPAYKLVAHHYFRLRLLQSEILQVQQERMAEYTRSLSAGRCSSFMPNELPSPYLSRFESFQEWRLDVDRRLWEWQASAPQQADIGVAFTPLYFELNYYQAVILLYKQSLSIPEALAGELSPSTGEVQSPSAASLEAKEDEEMVFMKVAQAGQMVLKIYRSLNRLKLVNYTFLATHHIFMSGTSFLYAIWQSPTVRQQLNLDDVDFTVFIATSVLTDLIDNCPPAEACKDAFLRMSKATISMVMRTTGFGNTSTLSSQPLNSPGGYFSNDQIVSMAANGQSQPRKRNLPLPAFDMNLKGLFSDDELASRPLTFQPKTQSFEYGNTGGGVSTTQHASIAPLEIKQEFSPPNLLDTQGSSRPQQVPNGVFANQLADNPPYQLLGTSQQQQQPLTFNAFDDLSFLDTLPYSETNEYFNNNTDFDFNFGASGTGHDSNGGGLLDEFWFGDSANAFQY